jgi:hypothetical protein
MLNRAPRCTRPLADLFKMAVIMVAITGNSFGNSGIAVGRLFWKSFGNLAHSSGVWLFPGRILGGLCFLFSLAIGCAYGGAAYHPTLNDCKRGGLEFLNIDTNDDNTSGGDAVDHITCSQIATWCKSTPCSQATHWNVSLFAVWLLVVVPSGKQLTCVLCTLLRFADSVTAGFVVFFIVLFLLSLFSGILLTILDTTFLCFLLDKEAGVVTKPQFHRIFGTVLDHRAKSMKVPRTPPKPPSYLGDMAAAPQYSVNQPVVGSQPPGYTVAPGGQPQGFVQPAGHYGTSPVPAVNPYAQPQQTQQGYPQPTYPNQSQYEDQPAAPPNFDPMTGKPVGGSKSPY